ncbi:MAG: hypothetical protein KY452_03830 [Actinobacteria bacterium]|nr:hypothetical protein [Actinomycetota bacterium]
MDDGRRDRAGRRLTLVGIGLGVLVPAGLAALSYVNTVPPHRGLGVLSFPLVWAMPAMLAALSLPSRPFLLVPATVLGFLSAFTPFLLMSVAFLVPAVLYWLAYSLRGPQPMAHSRAVAAVLVPVLAGAGAFFVLMAHPDPLCWDWREDPSGERTYTTVRGEACATNPSRGIDPVLVEPGTENRQTGRGGTSDTVSAPEAAASAALVVAGLLGSRALAGPAPPSLAGRAGPGSESRR